MENWTVLMDLMKRIVINFNLSNIFAWIPDGLLIKILGPPLADDRMEFRIFRRSRNHVINRFQAHCLQIFT